MESPGNSKIFYYGLALVACLTLLVFRQVPSFGFVNWDDMIYVYENPWIQGFSWKNIRYVLFHFLPKENYHPLVMLSYMVEYSFAGLNPQVYHITNLLLHLTAVGLLAVWLRLWNPNPWVPVLAAGFFAIHPLHVETVCWISDRKDLLMTVFSLLTLIEYHRLKVGSGSEGRLLLYFMAALFSKTSAAVLPIVFFVLDEYVYAKQETRPAPGFLQKCLGQFREKWVYWVMAGVITLLVAWAQRKTGGIHEGGITGLQWVWRPLLNISAAFMFYVKKTLLPLNLINQYFGLLHATVSGIPVAVAAPVMFGALCLGVLFSGWFTWKIRFAFLLTLSISLPYLQWVPLGHSLVWDRYFYLGSAGVFWLLAEGIVWLWARTKPRVIRWVIPLLVAGIGLFWSVLAYRQTFHWKDGISLWSSNLKRQPGNRQALQNLYRAYRDAGIKGDSMRAVLNRGLRYHPNDFLLNQGMGEYCFEQADYDCAREHLIRSILDYNANRDVYYLLAHSNLKLQDTAGYLEQLRIAEFMGHNQAKWERMALGK